MNYFNPAGELKDKLSKFNLYESEVVNLSLEIGELLRTCLRFRLITQTEIEKIVHNRLCEISIENILTHIDSFNWQFIRYPDHSFSPVAFGYAIAHKKVPRALKKKIRFDHGETFDDYIKQAQGLLEKVMRDIFNRKPTENTIVDISWEPCGDGGPCTC